MRKTIPLILISLFTILLTSFQCDDDPITTCEELLENLNELKIEIEALANSSVCNETFECRYIGFGSKPCGGPWSYLVYTTSIDTQKLKLLVDLYNANQDISNVECNAASDCSVENPPTEIICKNNKCIALY